MQVQCFIMAAAVFFAKSDWYHQKFEGWYYFQEHDSSQNEFPISPQEAADILAEEKRELEETLSLAILVPTDENIKNYALESKRQIERSSRFADAWGEVVSQASILQALSKTHFLLFCFSGKDPASIDAAKIAEQFVKTSGWKLKSFSLDGCGIDGLDFEEDRAVTDALDIRCVPAFYAVDPMENKITFLGNGMDLEQNIFTQLGTDNASPE
ncbi:MAG TPA: conjugal transfer protein TraF [Chlamydiales bacterium]|nr:conjugal transfer protein TraF [Chlamydiales bacterium]